MNRTDILKAAEKCICGDRDKQYGSPENNFRQVSDLWSVYLGKSITPADVAIMMTLFKIARIRSSIYQDIDSWMDGIGYLACGEEIAIGGTDKQDDMAGGRE